MLPETGLQAAGAAGLVGAFIAFIRFFLWRQIQDLREDVETLQAHVDRLEVRYDEERGAKHKALNDVAKTTMALDLVQRLAEQCTCNALAPLHEIIERLVAELATYPGRRHDDPPEEP